MLNKQANQPRALGLGISVLQRRLIRIFHSLSLKSRSAPDLSWITSTLSISGTLQSRHFRRLKQLQIGAIVDLREEAKDDEDLLSTFGIRLLHLPVLDHLPPSQAQLAQGTQWVSKQVADGRKVLIHCREGIGRSVVLACCVLMINGQERTSALRLVEARRRGVALSRSQAESIEQFSWQIRPPPRAIRDLEADANHGRLPS